MQEQRHNELKNRYRNLIREMREEGCSIPDDCLHFLVCENYSISEHRINIIPFTGDIPKEKTLTKNVHVNYLGRRTYYEHTFMTGGEDYIVKYPNDQTDREIDEDIMIRFNEMKNNKK